MPFSTGIFGKYYPPYLHLITPFAVYIFNVLPTGMANFFLWSYVSKPANHVTEGLTNSQIMKQAKQRALIVPLFFSALFTCIMESLCGKVYTFIDSHFMQNIYESLQKK